MHKQSVSPNTPLTTLLHNEPKLRYTSATADDETTTTVGATTTNAATTATTTMLTQHGKRQQDATHETEPETTSKFTWQTIKKMKRSSPITENRPQQLEFNCNNRYEQLSQLADADNGDIMLTDGTDNPQLTKENSRQRGPKPPPIFVYGVTNFTFICNH
jgi:hypothetical protein